MSSVKPEPTADRSITPTKLPKTIGPEHFNSSGKEHVLTIPDPSVDGEVLKIYSKTASTAHMKEFAGAVAAIAARA